MLKKAIFFLLLLSLPLFKCHIHSQKLRKQQTSHHEEVVGVPLETWLLAIFSAVLIGCCGVLPLLFNRWIDLDKVSEGSTAMQVVLSFAVGGLLGDVWLHLIPEATTRVETESQVRLTGLWVIIGLFTFMAVERLAKSLQSNKDTGNGVRGYLNLLANCTDNFTHGLAVAASYMVGPLVGILTTLAIICHEIPHEIGDFAILLRSGFSCPGAAWAQLATASGGLFGVVLGLLAEEVGRCTSWMLPFTGGGFLYIALVGIIPELNERRGAAIKQVVGVLSGVMIMAAVTIIERKSCNVIT